MADAAFATVSADDPHRGHPPRRTSPDRPRRLWNTGAVSDTCTHLDTIVDVAPSGNGCVECLQLGMHWLHLRRCSQCGHIGCCDNSPGKHATAHFHGSTHPIIQSYEPGEDWYFCYVDDLMFEIAGQGPSPSHT
jgi:hypothetical protein